MAEGSGTDAGPVVVVSGLPRSGTSMMMRMLKAGGLKPLADGLREADEDNPRGYFEFERVKGLPADRAWLDEAGGRAVKVISGLLEHLPRDRSYRVVFLHRTLAEVLASQRRMLERRGRPADPSSDAKMGALFEKHLAAVARMLEERSEIAVLNLNHGEVLADPRLAATRIAAFLADLAALDTDAMAAAVDPALYRQRVVTPA
jgi:hypothetical protein